MKAIKVADATPRQIDWLVAKCEGLNPNTDPERRRQFVGYPGFAEANGFGYGIKQYSSDWSHGGPIIERERILIQPEIGKENAGNAWSAIGLAGYVSYGPTPLVAAMRCCCSKLGDEVEVPKELK